MLNLPLTLRQLRGRKISKPIGDALRKVRPEIRNGSPQVGMASFLIAALELSGGSEVAGVTLPPTRLRASVPLVAEYDPDAQVAEELAAAFEDAFEIRRVTGGKDSHIGMRHLVFSLLTAEAEAVASARRDVLGRIGVDQWTAANQAANFCLYNREPTESRESWSRIISSRAAQIRFHGIVSPRAMDADDGEQPPESTTVGTGEAMPREENGPGEADQSPGGAGEGRGPARPAKAKQGPAKKASRKPRPVETGTAIPQDPEPGPPEGGPHDEPAAAGGATGIELGADAEPPGTTTSQPERRPEVPMLQADDPWSATVEDHSGALSEAEAFAAMVTAAQFDPPLAVGIFGDWGSGKSFFMRLLHDAVAERARQAEEDEKSGAGAAEGIRFFSKVVQIRFNAWHYAETNLWASLVDHIFVCLDKWAEREKQGSQADRLFDRLATARSLTVEAAEQLLSLRREHAEATLKCDEAATTLKTRRAELENSAATYFRAAWSRMPIRRRFAVPIAAAGLVLALAVAAAVALWLYQRGEPLQSGLVKAASTFASVALPSLIWAWTAAKRSAAALRGVDTAVDTQIEGDLAAADQARREAERRLHAAQAAASEAEERLRRAAGDAAKAAHDYHANTGKGRALDFVRARLAKGDYAAHLGFIATVRRDFEELSARMKTVIPEETAEARALHEAHVKRLIAVSDQEGGLLDAAEVEKMRSTLTEPEGQEPVFQRIILYIDDLDRCPPNQVVKVLQAIHLLLTFPLFVVFVAVDVRWLRHALAKQYAGQVKGVEDSGGATASASDYLEKIFQIPYWVRPIDVEGTCAILESRMGGTEAGEEDESDDGESDLAVAPAPFPTFEASGADARNPAAKDDEASPPSPVPQPPPPPPQRRPASRSLRLTGEERKFIQASAALLDGSPRRTLRFLNTYRIIKGSLGPAEVTRLEEGGYRALLTMLSIAVSIDDCYPALLEALSNGTGSPLNILRYAFEQEDYGSVDDRARVQRALNLFARQESNDLDLPFYARLAARYSFNPAVRLLVAPPSDESSPDLPH